jgi:hypothetical protein
MPKSKRSKEQPAVPPELSETEADLLSHLHGYQLETTSLGGGPLLRNMKSGEVVRTASGNMNTVEALQERGLIRPVKGRDPLTTVWA